MLRVLYVLALGGCDQLFQLDPLERSDATMTDSAPDAVRTTICDDPFVDDTFDDNAPCNGWGTPISVGGCAITEQASGLVFAPDLVVGSRCRCQSAANVPLSERGIMVDVESALGGTDGDFTALSLAAPLDVTIAVSNRKLIFANNDGSSEYGSVTYLPEQARWWRLRRSDADLVAEYGPDGLVWYPVGPAVPRSQTEAVVFLIAGLNNNASASPEGEAVYRRLIVCR